MSSDPNSHPTLRDRNHKRSRPVNSTSFTKDSLPVSHKGPTGPSGSLYMRPRPSPVHSWTESQTTLYLPPSVSSRPPLPQRSVDHWLSLRPTEGRAGIPKETYPSVPTETAPMFSGISTRTCSRVEKYHMRSRVTVHDGLVGLLGDPGHRYTSVVVGNVHKGLENSARRQPR